MKIFFATLSAILTAAVIIVGAIYGIGCWSMWQAAKTRAIVAFSERARMATFAQGRVNEDLAKPASVIQHLSPDEISSQQIALEVDSDASKRARSDAREAGDDLKAILQNKPFYLPLNDDEQALLDSIDSELGRAPKKIAENTTTPPTSTAPKPVPSPSPVGALTLTTDVPLKVPYGEVTLKRGTKLVVTARPSATTVRVIYLDHSYDIAITATDLK
jgi:hypothetical protein